MDTYSFDGSQTVASPTDTLMGLTASTLTRARIEEIIVGSVATPANNMIQILVQRYTAAGTSTAVTPAPLDSAAPAAQLAGAENHTVEPTYTAGEVLLGVGAIMNQLQGFHWVALDPDRHGLIVPATSANGIGVAPVHASFTGDVEGTIIYTE